jgi:chaperonin GroES
MSVTAALRELARLPANTSGIVPLDHRVLVLRDAVEEKTRGGIILPDSELDKQKHATTNATVIAVGGLAWSEAKHDAKAFRVEAAFPEPGSRVKVGRYTGDQHKGSDGTDYTILNDTDVIALLVEE